MSGKSNLGKRTEIKLSQPLDVDCMNYSNYSLKLPQLSTVGGDSQTTEINRTATIESLENGMEKKKKKYRRSMLGQRNNLCSMDSVLNTAKNFPSIHSEQELPTDEKKHHQLISPSPQRKNLKLFSSTPNSENHRSLLRHSQKTTSECIITPPNPFGYQEAASEFFDSEINDIGAWSVFKTKQIGIKSPSPFISAGKNDNERLLKSAPQIKKHLKTKLFDKTVEKFQSGTRINGNLPGTSTLNSLEGKQLQENKQLSWIAPKSVSEMGSKDCSVLLPPNVQVIEKTFKISDSDVKTSESDSENHEPNCHENTEDNEVKKSDFSDQDDSFSLIDSTIIAPKEKSASKTPKLSIIREEACEDDDKHWKLSKTKLNLSDDLTVDSSEQILCNEKESIKNDLENLSELCRTVQQQSCKIDSILEQLFKERKVYNLQFNKLQKSINHFQAKYKVHAANDDAEKGMDFRNLTVIKKKRRIISTNLKSSPVLMLSPDNILVSPFSNKISNSKRKKSQFLNSYTELRKGLSYLQTPERANKKKQVRSSLCYTPNSLSSCISEQLKCLDST